MKSKLKPVQHSASLEELNNDMYHCCRWCHHYESGKCYNHNVVEGYVSDSNIYLVSEEGRLSEVIEETFHSVRKSTVTEDVVKLLRSYNLSEKRIKEVYDTVVSSIDQWFDFEVKEKLDNNISVLYQSAVNDKDLVDGVEISNPEEHWCKEFM